MASIATDFYTNVSEKNMKALNHALDDIEQNESDEMKNWHKDKPLEWKFGLLNPFVKDFFLMTASRLVLVNDYYTVYIPNKKNLFDDNGHLISYKVLPNIWFKADNNADADGDRVQLYYDNLIVQRQILVNEAGTVTTDEAKTLVNYLRSKREAADALEKEQQQQKEQEIAERRNRMNSQALSDEKQSQSDEVTDEQPKQPEAVSTPKKRVISGSTKATGSKFDFAKADYIISANPIPDGFVFLRPIYYAHSEPVFGLKQWMDAGKGYIESYKVALQVLQNEIDAGKYDAVFNLHVVSHQPAGAPDYETIIYGDGCVVSD